MKFQEVTVQNPALLLEFPYRKVLLKLLLVLLLTQDLLWTMVSQWDFFKRAGTQGLPRSWQIHNHCLPLTNFRGVSGEKVSQWQLFKCMRNKFGSAEFSYMPESLILPE